jgi:hypothetical protein
VYVARVEPTTFGKLLPLVATGPERVAPPEPPVFTKLHVLAFADDQVSLVVPPEFTVVGLADIVAVGVRGTDIFTTTDDGAEVTDPFVHVIE